MSALISAGLNVRHALLAAAIALGVTACASSAKKTPSPEFFAGHQDAVSHRRAAVVVDACEVRDEIGSDYILRAASLERGERMVEATQAFLAALGHEPAVVTTPLLCGALGEAALDKIGIAEAKGHEEQPLGALPIILDGSLADDPELAGAYRTLVTAVSGVAPSTKGKDGSDPVASPIEFAAGEQARLREHVGTRHLWLLQFTRLEVSGGKSFGIAMMTGVASLALSGGMFLSMSHPVGGEAYSVSLVDLDAGEVLWKKVVLGQAIAGQMRRLKTEPYGPEWTEFLFTPMLPGAAR